MYKLLVKFLNLIFWHIVGASEKPLKKKRKIFVPAVIKNVAKKKVWLPFLRFFFNKKTIISTKKLFRPWIVEDQHEVSAFCTSLTIILFRTNKKFINALFCLKKQFFQRRNFFQKNRSSAMKKQRRENQRGKQAFDHFDKAKEMIFFF